MDAAEQGAWLYLEAELTLYAVQINVVIAGRGHRGGGFGPGR